MIRNRSAFVPNRGQRPSEARWIRGASRGFTLLEVLVVMAVIAMLIAMLVPGLRSARAQTKRLVCQTNLRQIAGAWHMYLEDYDGHFLKGINTNWNYGGKQGRGEREFGVDPTDPGFSVPKPLNPYLGLPEVVRDDAEVFHCPADKGGGDVPTTHFYHKGTSYVTNLMLVGPTRLYLRLFDPCLRLKSRINRRMGNVNRSEIRQEAKVILMGDAGWPNARDFQGVYRIEWHGIPSTHNIAFLDGHVDFVRIHKGLLATPEYSAIPFEDLQAEAYGCQEEVKP